VQPPESGWDGACAKFDVLATNQGPERHRAKTTASDGTGGNSRCGKWSQKQGKPG